MMASRSLAVHGAILVIAGVLALRTLTHEPPKSEVHAEAELWGGTPAKIEKIRYEQKLGTMTLEPRKDKEGRYFVGTVVKDAAAEPEKPKDPHGHGGKDPHASEPPPEPKKPGEKTTGYFVSVAEGEELFENLAPMKALRVLGRIEDSRKEEFGFHEEEGRLYVTVSGQEHGIVIGGKTPGGTDYYVRDPGSGEAYVISGNVLRDLMSADTRLVERKLHKWDPVEVRRVKLTAGEATRELVKSAEKKDFWADPGTPDQKDETASNWMSKVERLRVTRYEGEKLNPPINPADVVVKIEYFDDRKPIGFVEIVRRPSNDPGKDRSEYVAQTEQTRWYATVLRSTAEQIDQDAKSVLTP